MVKSGFGAIFFYEKLLHRPLVLEGHIPTRPRALSADEMVKLVATTLDQHKAEDIVVIPLKGKSDIADYMVIASGRSNRHVSTLADYVSHALAEKGFSDAHVEGKESADWVLVDAYQVIVHLFRPEVRAFYNLERMWDVPPPASTNRDNANSRVGQMA